MWKFDHEQTNSNRVISKIFGVEECWSYISLHAKKLVPEGGWLIDEEEIDCTSSVSVPIMHRMRSRQPNINVNTTFQFHYKCCSLSLLVHQRYQMMIFIYLILLLFQVKSYILIDNHDIKLLILCNICGHILGMISRRSFSTAKYPHKRLIKCKYRCSENTKKNKGHLDY